MNFQQLRILRAATRHGFNLTEAAERLHTSQSGVSRHIRDLEQELGVELFVREGRRLTGLTEPGREVMPLVERMLVDAENIKRVAEQFSRSDEGALNIATTHTQARYVLPEVIKRFRALYPRVHLCLHQGSPGEIVERVTRGDADLGIATESMTDNPLLVSLPYYRWHHALIMPEDHPLAGQPDLSLEALAAWPIVTYHEGFTGRARIDATFAQAGLAPDIVLSALDADVIVTYVRLGLGVGIVASMALDSLTGTGLATRSVRHLFGENQAWLAVHEGRRLRDFVHRFIGLCIPEGVGARELAPLRIGNDATRQPAPTGHEAG
jgi:LysR family cys regulon transcriptional activator